MQRLMENATDLTVLLEDGVLTIELDRQEKKNALNQAMYRGLTTAFDFACSNDDVKVVLLTAKGDYFCSGNDLSDFASLIAKDTQSALEALGPILSFMNCVLECPKPIVASVSGSAIGVGATMLLHCDLVFMADHASLRFPFVELGLVPEFGSSWLLPRLLGPQRAAQCLLLGGEISAKQAEEWGLVNEVRPIHQLETHVLGVCQHLTGLPSQALQSTKSLLTKDNRLALKSAMQQEQKYFIEGLKSAEFRKVLDGFFGN